MAIGCGDYGLVCQVCAWPDVMNRVPACRGVQTCAKFRAEPRAEFLLVCLLVWLQRGDTPMHDAARQGRVEVLSALAALGAPVDTLDKVN